MRRLLTTLSCLAFVFCVMAQTSLKGVLVDEQTGKPIVGATVKLANQNIITTTNQQGEFNLIYLDAINEEMILEAQGYVTDVKLVQLQAEQANELGEVKLKQDTQSEMNEEVLLTLSEEDLNDDEGRSQSMSSGSNASTDVFNRNTGFAWSAVRYRQRGYEQKYEQTYINGVNFNGAERGTFNYSMLGGLNDASRNKDINNPLESSDFTFGNIGKSTNIMMEATRFAQGWKIGLSGTNRTYKGRVFATYASGLLNNGWAFVGSLAWRYSPYIDKKGIIGEGQDYNSIGYFFSAQKIWSEKHKLSIVTFGAPTQRSQSAAVTQEVYDLTGSIYYNPYWGYQNGKVRNSRVVKSFDPTAIVSYNFTPNDRHKFKFAVGYHYSLYSNSALTFYNAPDPRPDYYRNLPSFLMDGQIGKDGKWITSDMNGNPLQDGTRVDGTYVGGSVDLYNYEQLTDLWKSRDNAVTQINWDNLYAANYAYNEVNKDDPYRSSKYILERRHNDLMEGAFNFNYQNNAHRDIHLKMTVGAEAKYSQGIHYKTIDDLLGGDQWFDVDPFAERDIKDLATNIGMTQADIEKVKQNDIFVTDKERVTKKGDKFGYDYNINMLTAKTWFQNDWNWNHLDLYYAVQLTYSYMQRSSNMVNGRAWYQAQINPNRAYKYLGANYKDILAGKKATMDGYDHFFVDPAFKVGLTYKINARNRLKLNGMAQTAAPLARDAYISQRVHDRVIEQIYTHDHATSLKEYYGASQKIVGGDLTYEFNYNWVQGRITGYFTQFWNGTELNGYYDDEARTFVNQALTGINKRHFGGEFAAAFKLGNYFTLTPMVAVGDYRYTSNAYCVTSAENGMALAEKLDGTPAYELEDSVYIKGLHVSAGPQVNASLKLSFFHPKMWFADITVSYYDWSYLGYAPARRMMGLYKGTRADGTLVNGSYANLDHSNTSAIMKDDDGNIVYNKYDIPELISPYSVLADQESLVSNKVWNRFMIDASVGKLIYLPKRQSLSINLSVSNLTNNTHFKTGGYQQARLPRQTIQGVADNSNSVIAPNVWKFPAKYYYAWGVNFFLNVTYKF